MSIVPFAFPKTGELQKKKTKSFLLICEIVFVVVILFHVWLFIYFTKFIAKIYSIQFFSLGSGKVSLSSYSIYSTIMLNSGTRTHREWRKVAKRERRRRLRTEEARARDSSTKMTSEEYQNWLKEQEELEAFEYEQIERINVLENKKWMEAEKIAIEHWNMLQEGKRLQLQEYLQQEAKLKMEWELEQKRRKEVEEKLKKIEEEKKIQQQLFMSKLEQFLSGDLTDPPPELLVSHETKPLMEVCPFFNKTACCRFGDQCSRNHRYPGISKVLLATNFYVHFGLSNANFSEYDTDVMLEYEDSDTQKEFVEFFNDVVPEFEKFGRIIQFKVSLNSSIEY
ncbi:unnamed protein product [Chilo suppressalis]|uniref:C3H1-type domain-containing protein n=1 Tax=Chilo suppressalis TaxID=168631 RepID=A0ABN8LAY3_CHISP|nr:unnamed protein product [Chilo suppressalis]